MEIESRESTLHYNKMKITIKLAEEERIVGKKHNKRNGTQMWIFFSYLFVFHFFFYFVKCFLMRNNSITNRALYYLCVWFGAGQTNISNDSILM